MSEQNPAGATVPDLIRLREQLTGWIAKLDEVGPQASSRVAERVRADYAERLRRVNEDLSSHRGEIEADLAQFRTALDEAEQARGQAADALDELSLRHLIGELDQDAWDEARPGLEGAVQHAEEAVSRARGEVERLEQLAAEIAGTASAAAPPSASAPVEEETPPPLPPREEPAAFEADEPVEAAAPEPQSQPEAAPEPSLFSDADEFEPDLPDFEDTQPEGPAPAAVEETAFEAPSAAPDARAAADAASVDEWDPFGNEFGAEAKPGDAEEDLPWLEGIDEAARGGWTPPAADEGLDFLREIEESTRGGGPNSTPPATPGDLGADDLAFLEELDRAIGSSPSAPGGSRSATPPPPPQQPAAATPAGAAAGSRAEPLLCKECGAINEPHSWYCEICGSEL